MARTTVGRSLNANPITLGQAYEAFRLRCFFGFLARERMIPQNSFQLVEKPRMEKKLLKPLSLDQARLLLAAVSTKRWTDHNLRTIMVLIFDTGLRVSEVIGQGRVQASQFFLGPRGALHPERRGLVQLAGNPGTLDAGDDTPLHSPSTEGCG